MFVGNWMFFSGLSIAFFIACHSAKFLPSKH
jgi:hypothetical protein